MKRLLACLVCVALVWWLGSGQANAQTGSDDTRPATTTFLGDTGLWFVPTGEILPDGRWSVSGYRANFDREQGFTDISHFAATFGVGVRDRIEIFGSFALDTRIRRGFRGPDGSVFDADNPEVGGQLNEYPFVSQGWIGDRVGDFVLGAKFNLWSEYRLNPAALAVRAAVNIPTGDDSEGAGTGKADFLLDGILSKVIGENVELSGFGGVVLRASPDNTELSNGFRWGVGAGFPVNNPIRVFAEVHGEASFDEAVVSIAPVTDFGPLVSPIRSPLDALIGVMWQGSSGVFAGGGMSWAARHRARSDFGIQGDPGGDTLGLQVRIGYHPGTPVFMPPLPPPEPPVPPSNGPPSVTARCNPASVLVGGTSTCVADAQDPDGDTLSYKWSAPAGTFGSPQGQQTAWTAPGQTGPVPITVTVSDGRGGTDSDTVTIQVTATPVPPRREYTFEDVHFDFDRYSLRPGATRILDEAIAALGEDPDLRIEIEGHTCNIGTAEYNLALGERRSTAVRDYLTSRGVGANRLQTVSYGEERPRHDNMREETRRLNRRAALVVRVQ